MKKIVSIMVITCFVLAVCVTPVLAQGKRSPEEVFAKLDKNSDGKLSLEEFVGDNAKNKERRTEQFKKVDTNNDNFVSKEEYMAMAQRAGKKKK